MSDRDPAVQWLTFRAAAISLDTAREYLPLMQNDFEATAARRALIETCVKVADEYGHEVLEAMED